MKKEGMSKINTEDIESMKVLKDEDAVKNTEIKERTGNRGNNV